MISSTPAGLPSNTAIVDLDDFHESNHSLEQLLDLRARLPGFRVTLFTIPANCSDDFLSFIRDRYGDWVDLVPHGWQHLTSRECQHWTVAQMRRYLDTIEPLKLTRGFKAPGWQISQGCYEALAERGYWVADHVDNAARRPAGLAAYLLDSPIKVHGHIGHMGGFNENELSLITPELLTLRGREFGFCKDHLCR